MESEAIAALSKLDVSKELATLDALVGVSAVLGACRVQSSEFWRGKDSL